MSHTPFSDRLIHMVDSAVDRLKGVDPEQARLKPSPEKWSKQEILGHLIDSATNNHQRFVRALESDPLVFPKYEQNHWVRAQAYNEGEWDDLLQLWRLLNRHIAHVVSRIPESRRKVECRIGPLEPATLGFLIDDYLDHLEHHLGQL